MLASFFVFSGAYCYVICYKQAMCEPVWLIMYTSVCACSSEAHSFCLRKDILSRCFVVVLPDGLPVQPSALRMDYITPKLSVLKDEWGPFNNSLSNPHKITLIKNESVTSQCCLPKNVIHWLTFSSQEKCVAFQTFSTSNIFLIRCCR